MSINSKKKFSFAAVIFKLTLIVLIFPAFSFSQSAGSEDTLKINLNSAEKEFIQNNLQLLASRFNISAAKASVIQAKLWNNPNLSIGQNIYNKITGKFFDVTKTGNTDIQLQQLFLLAGKRNDQIKLAEINTSISASSFYDLLRSLKFELRTDFYDLYFLQKSLKFYDETIPAVKKTVDATQNLYQQHSILLSEVLRLKSLLFSLENERLGILTQISGTENDLNVLLADSSGTRFYYEPALNKAELDSLNLNNFSLSDAVQAAYLNRPDLKIAESNVKYEKTNLALQHALAIPDITLGGAYSRAGGYVPDYLALTVSIDLPVFNRNQGNIQVSENNLEADKAALSQTKLSIRKEVVSAYDKAAEIENFYKNFDRSFTSQYKTLTAGMIENYESRNMTIIEFTDFYESYRNSMLQMIQLQDNRMDAFENLNYAAGKDLIVPKD